MAEVWNITGTTPSLTLMLLGRMARTRAVAWHDPRGGCARSQWDVAVLMSERTVAHPL